MSEPATAEALTRRDRVRAATIEEIKQTARRLLVTRGPDAVSLRAIAREMGMTAPGLYRYFDSREVLIRAVVADVSPSVSSSGFARRPRVYTGGCSSSSSTSGRSPRWRAARTSAWSWVASAYGVAPRLQTHSSSRALMSY